MENEKTTLRTVRLKPGAIAKWLTKKNWSTDDLANKAEIDNGTVLRADQGKPILRSRFTKIVDALQATPSSLLPESEGERSQPTVKLTFTVELPYTRMKNEKHLQEWLTKLAEIAKGFSGPDGPITIEPGSCLISMSVRKDDAREVLMAFADGELKSLSISNITMHSAASDTPQRDEAHPSITPMITPGAIIKAQRFTQGKSITRLSEDSDVAERTITRVEHDEPITDDALAKIAGAMGLDLALLRYDRRRNPKPPPRSEVVLFTPESDLLLLQPSAFSELIRSLAKIIVAINPILPEKVRFHTSGQLPSLNMSYEDTHRMAEAYWNGDLQGLQIVRVLFADTPDKRKPEIILLDLLNDLPLQMRTLAMLRHEEGLTATEIAEHFGVSPKFVAKVSRQTLQRLHAMMRVWNLTEAELAVVDPVLSELDVMATGYTE